jgi:hypothetical protein
LRKRFAFVAGNDGKHTFAISRRIPPELCLIVSRLEQSEGAGNAGRPMHPRPARRKSAHGGNHRSTGITRHSLRNGFNGLLRALPGDEFFCHRHLRIDGFARPVGPTKPPPI